MKNAIVVCSLLASINLSAQYQQMLSDNHYWRGVVYGWGMFDYYERLEGDTIINETTYRKLYSSSELNGQLYLHRVLREDTAEQKVYVWTGEERLLYDFSLEVGESTVVSGVGADQEVTISSIDQVVVDGEMRRKLNFDDAWGSAYWIEGIGSSYGPADAALGPISDYGPVLTCFYTLNTLSWANPLNSESCDLQLQIADNSRVEFDIWPNPTGDNLRLRSNFVGAGVVEIFDACGKRILEMRAYENCEIDTQWLSPGLYSLRLTQHAHSASERFIKL